MSLTMQLTPSPVPTWLPAIAPGRAGRGEPANLVVQVTNPTVGSDGVVRDLPASRA